MECRQNTFQATNTVSHMRITCHVCAIFTYIYAHIHIHIYWIKNAFQAFAQVHCRQPLCSLCSIDYVLGNDISGVIEGPDQRRKQAQDKSCMYVFLHVSIHTQTISSFLWSGTLYCKQMRHLPMIILVSNGGRLFILDQAKQRQPSG